jgi:glycosyltransferase involved in cell wall biosynthesis
LELAKALKKWFLYPDVYVTWAPSLFWHGVRLCRRHRFSAILATGDPWSVVVMASRLATWAGVPFVADFRELWSGHSHRTNQQEIARFGESEQKVFERADLILANSPLEREILEASCKAVHPPRFISVENGFEVDELMAAAGSCSKLPAEPFIITYAGSFGYRKPDAFFAGLSAWLAQAPALKEKVRVKVAGPLEPRVIEMVAELGLEGVVEFLGYLPHHEVLDLLYSSHLLLAIVGTATNQDFDPTVPAKMYEYAATGRPVLLLAKPGGATRFFETVGGYGAWVDNESPSQITQALGDLYARYQDVGLPHQCNLEVGEYTYAAATRRLSDALLRILVHGQVVSS